MDCRTIDCEALTWFQFVVVMVLLQFYVKKKQKEYLYDTKSFEID